MSPETYPPAYLAAPPPGFEHPIPPQPVPPPGFEHPIPPQPVPPPGFEHPIPPQPVPPHLTSPQPVPPHLTSPQPVPPQVTPPRPASVVALLVPLAVGGAVALALGVYGRLHGPTGIAVSVAGFSSPQTVKVWLATAAAVLGLVQLGSALAMYGRLPGVNPPPWTGTVHRWSGRIAFLLTVPVAVHCLYALGFQYYDTRVLVHSLLGCAFFGAFAAKMLALPKANLPGWSLPVLGGLVFTLLIGLWLTASLWFFVTSGVTF